MTRTVVGKPELVNSDPYGEAWLTLGVPIANVGELSHRPQSAVDIEASTARRGG